MRFIFLFTILLISFSARADFVIALKPDKNPEQMLSERKELEQYFSKKLNEKVKVIIPLSGAVIQEGFANKTIDMAYLGSLDMIKAKKENLAEILVAGEIDGKTTYESYWLALKDRNYKSIQDLKNKPIAFSSPTSTSGYLIPYSDLVQKKLIKEKEKPESFFGNNNVQFGTGYVSAVEKVLSGQAEAAAVSDYVYNRDKHLKPKEKAQLKVVAKQGPVPTHVLAVRSGLSSDTKKKILEAVLAMNQENALLRDKVFTSKLIKVSDAHLKPTEIALQRLGKEIL